MTNRNDVARGRRHPDLLRPSQALFGVALDRPGEVVTLIGRNGMGKTTTIARSWAHAGGAGISVRRRGNRAEPACRIAQLGIGLVPEGRRSFPS